MSKKILTSLDLAKNEIQNAKFHLLAAEPSGGVLGQYYFNTTEKKLYIHNGAKFVAVGGDGVASIDAKTGETVIKIDNTDPHNPLVQMLISATQGDGVTVTEESDGLKIVVQDASTTQKGIVQLTSTPSATDESKGITPKGANVTVEEQATATSGYLKTYKIYQAGNEIGTIDIPKDFLVKSATTGTVTQDDIDKGGKFDDRTKYAEFLVGDDYIDFTINVKSGSADDEHIYLLCKKLGKFTHLVSDTLKVGDTSEVLTLPINSKFVSANLFDASGEICLCDIKVQEASDTATGSVTFTIAKVYTEDLICHATYIV